MRLAAAGLGADASQAPSATADSLRSRPQQSEVHQVGLLRQRRQKAPELHEELEGRCQHPKDEDARKAEPTSGNGEGMSLTAFNLYMVSSNDQWPIPATKVYFYVTHGF